MTVDKKPEKQKKTPRKISRQYLENAGLFYLQRYASSVANFRRVMTRKINRSCTFHKTDPAEFLPALEDIIIRYVKTGLLNDKGFAEARTASLRRQGRSKQAIQSRLQAKGLSRDDIDKALALVDEEREGNPEFEAALKLARRRKLGPFRPEPLTDPKDRQKEMAVMGRAGFSYDIARQVLDFQDDGDDGL